MLGGNGGMSGKGKTQNDITGLDNTRNDHAYSGNFSYLFILTKEINQIGGGGNKGDAKNRLKKEVGKFFHGHPSI